jgi:SAM-dependent methyltransferase
MQDTTAPVYVMGRSEAETARLQRQSLLYNPGTRRLFEDAGITAGMRVLDVGSGAGDVAMLAAEMVGRDGLVVGVDNDCAVLETARRRAGAAGLTQVRFVAGDIREAELDLEFDAVVGRLVLVHVNDPAAILTRLTSLLRPEGVVAFQEIDWSIGPVSQPPSRSLALVRDWAQDLFRRCGLDPYIGLALQRIFLAAGLPAPQLRLDAPTGNGADFPGYAYMESSVRSGLPQLIKFGIATADDVAIDTLAQRLRDEIGNGTLVLPTLVGAWARKPGAAA